MNQNDLASILTGGAPARAPAPTYDPIDAAVRTIYGETLPGATKEERQAVAAVIANRAAASGKPFNEVVLEPKQFEPWGDPVARKRIDALKPDSPEYQMILADVGDILAGKANPYPGLTHFYAPDAQASRGRAKPDWDDGTGTRIGSSLFFAKGGEPATAGGDLASLLAGGSPTAAADPETEAAFKATFGDPAKYGDKPAWTGAGVTPYKGETDTLSPGQQKTYETLVKGHAMDEKAPPGSIKNPLFEGPKGGAKDAPPGAYYVDASGKLQRAPGGDKESSMGSGFMQGLGDVATTVGQALPGTGDSELLATLQAGQMGYGAQYGGDLKSGIGRFGGQLAGSLPVLAGGEAALAPALRLFGPAGQFFAGQAGKAALPEAAGALARVGRLATRGGSLAVSGAGEGAAASALVSSANDAPLAEQLKTGALLGGALKPAGTAVGSGMRRFFGGAPLEGAADLAAQQAGVGAATGLPLPVPLSLGQITGAPAQQMAENAMLRGGSGDAAAGVMQAFKGEQQGALRGNVKAISDLMAGAEAEAGQGGKLVSERLNTMRDAAKKEIDAAYDAARDRGEDAMLSTAKDVREGMLEGLRKEYDLDRIKSVAKEVEGFGEKGAPTVRELFEVRTRLSNLSQSGDSVEGGAARKAIRALDAYTDTALKDDLFVGDPEAIGAWREAIKKRAAFGRLFEGDDLIDGLTERVQRGGGTTLKVDPEEATNYILNRSALGFVGKKDLGRDLKRLEKVLGPESEEWNALRAEVFMRVAKAGEGAPEGGVPQFSGQNFMKAWERVKRDDPQVVGVMFNPEERRLIDQLAQVAQKVTTPVKGGDNPSNSAITGKRLLEPLLQFLSVSGGAGGGAAVGGIPGAAAGAALGGLLRTVREIMAVGKAKAVTYGAKPVAVENASRNRLLGGPAVPAVGGVLANSLTGASQP